MNLKGIFFCILILISSLVNAQNYLIRFSGKGASNSVSQVKVENLTTGTSKKIYRDQILRLVGTKGLPLTDQSYNSLSISPNPMTKNSTMMMVYPPESGKAVITIFNTIGKLELEVQGYLGRYPQVYQLSGFENGMHIISITGSKYHLSGKLLCAGNAGGSMRIEKISSDYPTDETTEVDNLRPDMFVDMAYSDGDILKFTGISERFSTVKVDSPLEDKTVAFNFVPCFDGDNNSYPVVEIGTQTWMAENLKTTHYNDSSYIECPGNDSLNWLNNYTGAYAWYNNNIKFKNDYGALYNWYAVNNGNLCPAGWHIPSTEEWIELSDNLGGQNLAGIKLKETGNLHWVTSRNAPTNESGFSALPGGLRDTGIFTGLKKSGYLWSSTFKTDPVGSSGWVMNSLTSDLTESKTHFLNEGLSVRCILGDPVLVKPEVKTNLITDVSSKSATGGASLLNNGGNPIIALGFCWGDSKDPTTASNNFSDKLITGFTSKITNLLPGKTYYIRAFATNSRGTAYGNDLTFTTLIEIPSLITSPATEIKRTSAVSGGNISTNGGSEVTVSGLCYSTSHNPTINGSHTSDGLKNGSFSVSITNLTANTVYYVKSYATNAAGTGYGNEISFKTAPPINAVITTSIISGITSTSAKTGGNITDDGDGIVTERGVCWSDTPAPTIQDDKTSDGDGNGIFSSTISGLTPATTYFIRAYATNDAGTAYGNQLTFKTTNGIPIVITSDVTAITNTTASSGGSIDTNGGLPVSSSGICWSTSHNPTVSGTHTSNGTKTGSFTSNITGLTANTTYYVRAYATNNLGTGYGNEVSFLTMPALPSLTTTTATEIGRTYATLGGNITSNGGGVISTSGICWSTTHSPTIAGSYTTDGTISGSFESTMNNLDPNKTYYVKAYATNSSGTGYGNEVSVKTYPLIAPKLTTISVSDITSVTASSGGTITDDGGAEITAKGVCWSKTATPTIASDKTIDGSGPDDFTSSIKSLLPATTYHLRAYATNSVGTAYGNVLNFTTDPQVSNDVTFTLTNPILLHSLGDKRIIFHNVNGEYYIQYSSNDGATYNQGVKVSGLLTDVNKARILDNGTIVLFGYNKIYYSTDNLNSISACTVLNKDGSPYILHTPVNSSYPGTYFNFMGGFASNNGVYVMGNYANNSMGASPVNLYYSLDGKTWKVFYTFGRNTNYTDNGTVMGGTGGTLLGDPANPLVARHIHSVNVGDDGNFYACSGDGDGEIHILKCTYNSGTDKWTIVDMLNATSRTWQRMRSLGAFERNGYLYWGSDGPGTFTYNGVTYDCFGIYKCPIADINNPAKHILLQPLTDACYSFLNSDHIVIAGLQSYGYVYISYDYGETWTAYAKPAWMTGSVQGVWYNQLNKYLGALYGYIIESTSF